MKKDINKSLIYSKMEFNDFRKNNYICYGLKSKKMGKAQYNGH